MTRSRRAPAFNATVPSSPTRLQCTSIMRQRMSSFLLLLCDAAHAPHMVGARRSAQWCIDVASLATSGEEPPRVPNAQVQGTPHRSASLYEYKPCTQPAGLCHGFPYLHATLACTFCTCASHPTPNQRYCFFVPHPSPPLQSQAHGNHPNPLQQQQSRPYRPTTDEHPSCHAATHFVHTPMQTQLDQNCGTT